MWYFQIMATSSITVPVYTEVHGRMTVKTEKNKSCGYCGEGKMTCHEASAYFTLPVLIVPLQNYSIVITSPTHCRHSDVLRLMVSAWEGVAGVQPAIHSPFYVVCCSPTRSSSLQE